MITPSWNRIVPLAIGASIVAVTVTEPLSPAANVPLVQVTTPFDSLPLPEMAVTLNSAGRWSSMTTLVASSVPVLR